MQNSFSRPGTAGARLTRPARPSTSSGRLSSSASSSGKIRWGGGSHSNNSGGSATQKNWPSFSWTRPGDKKTTKTTTGAAAAATAGGHAPPRIHLASSAGKAKARHGGDLNVSGSGLRSPTKTNTTADSGGYGGYGGVNVQSSFTSGATHASSSQASSGTFRSGQPPPPFTDKHARAISVLQEDIKILQACFSATSSSFSSTVDKILKRYIATTNPEHNEYAAGKLEEVLARCTSELLAAGQKEQLLHLHQSVQQERQGRQPPGMAAGLMMSGVTGSGLGASLKEPSGRMLKQLINFVQHTGSLVVEHGELLDRLASEQRKSEELRKTVRKLEEEKDLGKLALISNKMRSPTHEELERAKAAANATVDPLRFSESAPAVAAGSGRNEQKIIGLSISTAVGTASSSSSSSAAAATSSAGRLAKNAATSPLQAQTRDQATVMSPNMLKISQPHLHAQPPAASATTSSPKKKGKHHHHHHSHHKHKRSSSSTPKRKETDNESVDFLRRQRDAKEKELGVVKAAERKLFEKCNALEKQLAEKTEVIEQLTKAATETEQAVKKAHTRTSSAASEKMKAEAELLALAAKAAESRRQTKNALSEALGRVALKAQQQLEEKVSQRLNRLSHRVQHVCDSVAGVLSTRMRAALAATAATAANSAAAADHDALRAEYERKLAAVQKELEAAVQREINSQSTQTRTETGLRDQILRLRIDLKAAQESVATNANAGSQSADSERARLKLVEELAAARNTIAAGVQKLNLANEKVKQTDQALRTLQREKDDLAKKLESEQNGKQRQASVIEGLEQQISKMNETLQAAKEQAAQDKSTISRLTAQLENERGKVQQMRLEETGAMGAGADKMNELEQLVNSLKAAAASAEAGHKASLAEQQQSLHQLWSNKLSKANAEWHKKFEEARIQSSQSAAAQLARASNEAREWERKHRAAVQSAAVLEQQVDSERELSKSALRDRDEFEQKWRTAQKEAQAAHDHAAAEAARAAAASARAGSSLAAEQELQVARQENATLQKQLSDARKKLLLVEGQLRLEIDHWKEVATIAKTKHGEMERSLQETRQHYESVIETLRGQLEQSKTRDSAVSTATAALTSDLKTANTLLAMQRSKREDLQREIEALRREKEHAEEQLEALRDQWESRVKDLERERAEIDTEKEILRSVEETIFLRLKQQLELAELEPTLQASPENADSQEWQSAYDRVEMLQNSVSEKEAKLRDMADTMEQTRASRRRAGENSSGNNNRSRGDSRPRTATSSTPRRSGNSGFHGSNGGENRPAVGGRKGRKSRPASGNGTTAAGAGYHHDGGTPATNLSREEMMKKVSSVAKMRSTVAAHRRV